MRIWKRIAARADADQEMELLENSTEILAAHRLRIDFRERTAERCLQRESTRGRPIEKRKRYAKQKTCYCGEEC